MICTVAVPAPKRHLSGAGKYFCMIHRGGQHYQVKVSTGSEETRWLGGSFLMVYRNNAGRLGSSFISVCLESRWLGPKSGFYVPERSCKTNHTATDTIPRPLAGEGRYQ